VKCPNCGAENPDHVAYCGRCSTALAREDHRYGKASGGDSRLQGMAVNCPKCGEENRERAKYCDNCGAHLSSEYEEKITLVRPKPNSLFQLQMISFQLLPVTCILIAVWSAAFFALYLVWDRMDLALVPLCFCALSLAMAYFVIRSRRSK
jgi:uncharacterized membrane protein YvbJ